MYLVSFHHCFLGCRFYDGNIKKKNPPKKQVKQVVVVDFCIADSPGKAGGGSTKKIFDPGRGPDAIVSLKVKSTPDKVKKNIVTKHVHI